MFNKQEQLARAAQMNQQAQARGERKPVLPIPVVVQQKKPWPFTPQAADAARLAAAPRDQAGKPILVGDRVAYLSYVNGTPRVTTGVVLSAGNGVIYVNTRRTAITKFHNVVKVSA